MAEGSEWEFSGEGGLRGYWAKAANRVRYRNWRWHLEKGHARFEVYSWGRLFGVYLLALDSLEEHLPAFIEKVFGYKGMDYPQVVTHATAEVWP